MARRREVVEMSTGPSGARTIEELKHIFTVHGLPRQIQFQIMVRNLFPTSLFSF